MALKDDLDEQVNTFFTSEWTRKESQVVPSDGSINLNNDGVDVDATVLYAGLRASTAMVDGYKDWFAAAVYKAFLYSAAQVVCSEQAVVTSFDGDRIMAVFVGDMKNTRAARTALKINWIVENVVQPGIKKHYPSLPFVLSHTVGVDTSKLLVAKTGVRDANDLVWVGKAANHAAKLTNLDTYKAYVTAEVYEAMENDVKVSGESKKNMWDARLWKDMNRRSIYGSNWVWSV